MSQTTNSNQDKYGPILKSGTAESFSMDTFITSRKEKAAGRKGLPMCAWGEAGIGKTELPNLMVKKYADFFGGSTEQGIPGNIVYLPMAQIEEKAELQGLPDLQTVRRLLKYTYFQLKKATAKDKKDDTAVLINLVDAKKKVVQYRKMEEVISPENVVLDLNVNVDVITAQSDEGLLLLIPEVLNGSQTISEEIEDGVKTNYILDARTIYATPSWIPQVSTHGAKGLLVIDDMNRADPRIINSIMQLLQDGALLGWKLPEGWEIYCTCNPDNGKYEVTPFDGAQMTRMVNFVQKFDKDSWLKDWAIPTGIHPIAQNFVMTHAEAVVSGERTNPRSFDKFFRLVHSLLDDMKAASESVQLKGDSKVASAARRINDYGKMNIESTPLQTFISFLTSGFGKLPDVEEIIAKDFKLDKFYETISKGGNVRVDILASLNTRLILHLEENKEEYADKPVIIEGVRTWIMAKDLPADLRYHAASTIADFLPDIVNDDLCEIIYKRVVG